MEPPLIAAEDWRTGEEIARGCVASMEPPLIAAEDVGNPKQWARYWLLQWSRRSSQRKTRLVLRDLGPGIVASMEPPLIAAEDADAARDGVSAITGASMEPPLIAAEDSIAKRAAADMNPLQWSRRSSQRKTRISQGFHHIAK